MTTANKPADDHRYVVSHDRRSVLIVGPQSAGKTDFLRKLILNKSADFRPPDPSKEASR